MVNEDKGKIRKMVKKRLICLAATAALAITGYSSVYTVDQTQQAVVTQFGNPVRVVLNPLETTDSKNRTEEIEERYRKAGVSVAEGAGLRFKLPFIQHVTRFDKRLLRWNGYPEQIPTADKKYIWVDSTARFYIQDPLRFLNTVGTEEQAHGRLDDIIDSTTRNSITSRNLIETVRTDEREMKVEVGLEETVPLEQVREGRTKIIEEITHESEGICREKYGLGIHEKGVLIKGISYVDEVKVNVEGRMTAERQRIARKYISEGEGEAQKIMGDKDREVKTVLSDAYRTAKGIEGKADAQATAIYAKAFNRDPEFYRFCRTLQLYDEGLRGKDTRLIIGIDNPLFELIGGKIKEIKPTPQPLESPNN